jgi:hypothetical protein
MTLIVRLYHKPIANSNENFFREEHEEHKGF